MIIGISGTICSGKFSLVQYLVQTYQFEAVNLQHIFKSRLRQKLLQLKNKKKADSSDALTPTASAQRTLSVLWMAKSERSTALRELRKKIILIQEHWEEIELKDAIEKVKKEQVRAQILNEHVRADGRGLTQVRPISIDTNVLPNAHASCLFTRGQTQALVHPVSGLQHLT